MGLFWWFFGFPVMAYSVEQWVMAKALYETGSSLSEIAKATGIKNRTSIGNKGIAEGWIRGNKTSVINGSEDYKEQYFLKKTFDAGLVVKEFCIKNSEANKYHSDLYQSVFKVLLLDSSYAAWFKDYAEKNQLSDSEAYCRIVVLSNQMFGEENIKSIGEQTIANILNAYNIEFQREYTHHALKHKGKLRLDFYLPKYRSAIEFNGFQHYMPVEYFGGVEAMKACQLRDQIKQAWCNKYHVRLFEIKYSQDIDEEMKNILRSIGNGL